MSAEAISTDSSKLTPDEIWRNRTKLVQDAAKESGYVPVHKARYLTARASGEPDLFQDPAPAEQAQQTPEAVPPAEQIGEVATEHLVEHQ